MNARTAWIGYLRLAGPLDGALRSTPDRGRHYREGRHAKVAGVRLDIGRRDGSLETTRVRLALRAAWG